MVLNMYRLNWGSNCCEIVAFPSFPPLPQYYPHRVMSIDLGKINSAYTLIDSGYRVLKWKMMDFTWPKTFSPENLYNNVRRVYIKERNLEYINWMLWVHPEGFQKLVLCCLN